MAVPCRERVVAAIASVLTAIDGVADLIVERDRQLPVEAADLPCIVIYEGDEGLTADFCGEDGLQLQVDVEGYALTAELAGLRAAVDAAMLADRTLGGLVRDLELAAEPAPQRLDMDSAAPTKGFVRSYRVLYATREGDPFTFA